MTKNAIFLSGWEYNKLLSDNPFTSTQSGLPAEVLWNGAAQFWLFEKVFCTKESLEGDVAAANDLGWTTGFIFDDLRRRGFLEPVEWSKLIVDNPQLKSGIETRWSFLKGIYKEELLLTLIKDGRDDILAEIKLELLSPILRQLKCFQNISPNSIGHWIGGDHPIKFSSPVAEGMRALAEPFASERMLLRAGFTLCQQPGTGVSKIAVQKQQQIEQRIQKPMIPSLLAGLLPQNEYHNALRSTAAVYKPINVQLKENYRKNIEKLERLRDIAKDELWHDLHGEWLPRLEEDPAFLSKFKGLISDALFRSKFDPYLKRTTDVLIIAVSGFVGATAAYISGMTTLGAPISSTIGTGVGGTVKYIFDSLHKKLNDETDALMLFYQKALGLLRPPKEGVNK